MSLHVSTTAIPRSLRSTLEAFDEIGIKRVECGYCSDPGIDLGDLLADYDFEYVAHNYFRPVDDEFIVNLASSDPSIRDRSIEYVCQCIQFCDDHNIDLYTFHAGFRVDPSLDLVFPDEGVQPYSTAMDRFFDALKLVLDRTAGTDVSLAVENNVVSEENRFEDGAKLLLARPDGASEFVNRLPSSVGILLDTGHLTVSAETFGFSRDAFLDIVAPSVRCLHLHDNDGLRDRHEPPALGSWPLRVYTETFDGTIPATIEASFESKIDLQEYLRVMRNSNVHEIS